MCIHELRTLDLSLRQACSLRVSLTMKNGNSFLSLCYSQLLND